MVSFKSLSLVVVSGLALVACGGSTASNPTGSSTAQIDIRGFAFAPSALTVSAGDSITVTNFDTQPHTATSEAKQGDFQPGAVAGVSFDTGNLAANQSATVTIPASAPSGTVIPYFCVVHGSMMPEGTITVR